MKILVLCLPILSIFAQERADLHAAIETSAKSVIVIDPKTRSTDIAQAFEFLRKDKPSQKIMMRTSNGNLMNIVDVSPSTGSTLLLIKVNSNQGTRPHFLPVEQVMEITYSP